MEPRFGHDFSRVRVHADAKAAKSAQAVNALAYTVGQDMIFGNGQYAPNTNDGRRLLAHEMTHVVQQSGSNPSPDIHSLSQPAIQRKCGPNEIGVASDCSSMSVAVPESFGTSRPFLFNINCDTFKAGEEEALIKFVKDTATSSNDLIEIHGFASDDGDRLRTFNINLACARAQKARSVLIRETLYPPTSPQPVNHGPTQGDPDKCRSVLIVVKGSSVKPPPPFPNLPPPVVPKNPPGPQKPPGTPPAYCTPYPDIVTAMQEWLVIYAAMMAFSSRFGPDVQDLWSTYLNNPKTGTRGTLLPRRVFGNQTSRVVTEFRQDAETTKQKDSIMKLLADRVRGNPAIMPQVGHSTPIMRFGDVLKAPEMQDLPMTFTDGAHKIPGNIAGGYGKNASDAGDDVRNVDGKFFATNLGPSNLRINAAFIFDVLDCVDFCPGNPGDWKAQMVTIPMSMLEATPDVPTYDVPFEVIYGLSDSQDF